MPQVVRLSEAPRTHLGKDPNLTRDLNGQLWIAWHNYRMKEDRILVRSVQSGRRGPVLEISDQPGINFQPRIACDGHNNIWVVWSAQRENHWCILACSISEGKPGTVICLSKHTEPETFPAITSDAQGHIWVAWCSIRDGRHIILGRALHHGHWSDMIELSRSSGDQYRPALCGADNCAWLACESSHDGRYDIHLRRWTQHGAGRPVSLGHTGSWEMFPRLCPDGEGGVWATWVATHDVTNNKGFVDHKVDLMAAQYDGHHLIPYRSPDHSKPDGYVTHLYDGLLGRNWYMGFVGWRRRPQIVRTDTGHTWVLYERKEDERVNRHGPDALFYARPLTGPGRVRSFEIDRQYHAYTVSGDLLVESNRLPFAGQISEGRNYADICAGFLDLDQTHPVRERPASDWKQWKPIRLPEKSTAAVRPTIEANGKTYKLYWGDPHCHGNLSGDAEGEIDENYTYGRYKSCLDFMAVTDNDALYDNVFTPSEWALVQASARHFNEPGHFVAIPAYERTVPLEKGRGQNHRIQLFPQEGGPLYHWTEPDANTLKKWLGKMKNTGAYTFLHHTNWKAVPSPTLGGVEVCSSWDIYIHISKTIQEGLRNGLRLAFQGDSDSHRIVPGQGGALTGVWAEDLTREAIFEALWARRCFATNGERLLMDVRINGKPMGSEVHTTAPVTLTCNIQAPRQILSVELYRTGERIATKKISKKKASIEFEDRPSKGEHPYYIQVNLKPLPRTPMGARCGNLQVARGDYAWSSPIWAIVE